MAVMDASVTVKSTESPYRLDPEQTLKASQALLAHMKSESQKLQERSTKKSLLAPADSDDEDGGNDDQPPVWLNLATKQHIVDRNRLTPSKITVPHSLNTSASLTICLITTDPQRAIKNAVADPTFPNRLSSRITKIIGFQKLTARYKSYESRRQLLAEHDIFLADDRIITRLPAALGKVFYKGTTKRPIPISIATRKTAESKTLKKEAKSRIEAPEASVASPLVVAAEIERAINSIPVTLKPGLNVAVRVGLETFTSQQLVENISTVVPVLIEKHVVKGWRNVRSIHIKSPTSVAVPIWLSDDLWAEEDRIVDADEAPVAEIEAGEDVNVASKRKRNPQTTHGPQTGQRKKARLEQQKVLERAAALQRKQRLASQKNKMFTTDGQ